MTGLEVELNLVDEQGDPALRNAEALEAIADPDFQTELGQFNIEINVPPAKLREGGLATFEESLRRSLNDAEAKSAEVGAHLVMIGILPTLAEGHMDVEHLSANPRYRLLSEQILNARGEDIAIDIARQVERLAHHRRLDRARGGVHEHPAPRADLAGPVRGVLERLAGDRGGPAGASAPTRRTCSARSCGARPGSRCSSRRPTPAARS